MLRQIINKQKHISSIVNHYSKSSSSTRLYSKRVIPAFTPKYKNMLKDPSIKYKPGPTVPQMTGKRTWPDNTINKAPRWLSTDLRDGNQSLPDPMSMDQKIEYFHKLIELGFKEIEVGFPSASQTDFDFTRYAVENCPEDVTIQVLVQSREHLIKRTVESLKGAKRATIHTYLATSDLFRDVVFNMSQEDAIKKAVEATKLVRSLTKDDPSQKETTWQYEFSPECFSDTPVDFAVKVCEAVKNAWEPSKDLPIIFNLPATVEVSSPNVYADQVEYFAKNISEREKVSISVHCHNDRGCGVAATELALMAGADRVEGCIFGNGERTGNVDLVTVALNMYTHGVAPNLDFSDLKSVIQVSEKCNKVPVSPRAPYGGDLVVCAFSGSHQDAIKKGFQIQERRQKNGDPLGKLWRIPYLPLDPQDIGRDYEAVIRVNSQSGKGGAAWVILKSLGLDLPRNLQIEFSKIVQDTADSLGKELKANEITELFKQTYFFDENIKGAWEIVDYETSKIANPSPELIAEGMDKTMSIKLKATSSPTELTLASSGSGHLSCLINAINDWMGLNLEIKNYAEHALTAGKNSKAVSYVHLQYTKHGKTDYVWGIASNEDVGDASMNSVINGLNSILKK
ncbi:probable 2-isopropylmalate synthase [Hanseniaspora guilliermondii]|uniref:2-isopropylmalate synthase n=1 Tax=Hanseniaspora guilliermondii TaxID=56406 RepID=A0A1L0CIM2_9ASCO|nr:probable 2-isopropylmalate synthase [Hanseniaspora guilliermondii]